VIRVFNAHGIHGCREKSFGWHHVLDISWIPISLGCHIVDIEINSPLNPRSSFVLGTAISPTQKPRSIYKYDTGVLEYFQSFVHSRQGFAGHAVG
jgi:hypothetical protein